MYLKEIFISSLGNDLLNYSALFVSAEGCASSFQHLYHFVSHLTPPASMSRTMIALRHVITAILVCSLNLLEMQDNSRTSETHPRAYISSQMHLTNFCVPSDRLLVAQITDNQELTIQEARFHFFPKFNISEILRLIS